MLPYDNVQGYHYNRIVDAFTNTRQGQTVATIDEYAICFGYQPVDAVYKARCRFWVSPHTDTIINVELSFTLQPFHVGNQTTAQSTTTSAATVTSAGGSAHNHSVTGQTGTATTSGGSNAEAHIHTENTAAAYTQNAVTTVQGPTMVHTHTVPSISVSGATSTSESTHTHDVPGQSITIPSLSLNPPTAIYEAGMAQGVHVFIDGVDRTTALGGPFGSGTALDVSLLEIGQWITSTGWHELQLSSTSIGGVTAQVQFSGLINQSL